MGALWTADAPQMVQGQGGDGYRKRIGGQNIVKCINGNKKDKRMKTRQREHYTELSLGKNRNKEPIGTGMEAETGYMEDEDYIYIVQTLTRTRGD